MVVVSYSGKEINAKLVYYGAGLSGKTTNLESIFEAVPDTSRGKMVSMKTQSDRTLFFDLLPLDLGEIMGFKTRFLLYTVPGQVFYNATRKLVLKGADAVVFVADSEIGKMDENKESLGNLRANLAEYGVKLEEIPIVLQYNKRDLENKYSVDELNAVLNPEGEIPWFEAVASQSKGVFETFRGVSHLLMEKVTKDLRRTPLSTSSRIPRKAEPVAPATAHNPLSLPNISAIPLPPNQASISAPPNASDPSRPLEFGREVSLPKDALIGAEDPAPSLRRPEPALSSSVDPREPDARQRPMLTPVTGVAQAVAAPPKLVSEPATSVAVQAAAEPESSRVRPGLRPSESLSLAPASVGQDGVVEAVLPVTIMRGGTREIVLRIVITDHE